MWSPMGSFWYAFHLYYYNLLLVLTLKASTAPAYASEVLPLTLRVYLTSYTNMYASVPTNGFVANYSSRCFIIGQLIAAGVLKGLVR